MAPGRGIGSRESVDLVSQDLPYTAQPECAYVNVAFGRAAAMSSKTSRRASGAGSMVFFCWCCC